MSDEFQVLAETLPWHPGPINTDWSLFLEAMILLFFYHTFQGQVQCMIPNKLACFCYVNAAINIIYIHPMLRLHPDSLYLSMNIKQNEKENNIWHKKKKKKGTFLKNRNKEGNTSKDNE